MSLPMRMTAVVAVLLISGAAAQTNVTAQGNVACNSSISGDSSTGSSVVGHAAPEHWWRFTAPTSGVYIFNTCGSSYDTYVHLYNRSGDSFLGSPVSTCDDCGPCGLRTVLTTAIQAGSYFVVIDGFATSRGNYVLNITCPDAPSWGTLTCNGTNATVTGNTTGGISISGSVAPEHYFDFVAPYNGAYTFDTCGSGYDTYLNVYREAAGLSLLGTFVTGCDDCGPCGLRTVLTVTLTAGNYVVVVDGFASSSGAYTMTATCPTEDMSTNPVNQGVLNCSAPATGTTVGGQTLVGNAAPENWWQFDVEQASGSYTFNSCGSSFDTWLHVYARNGTNNASYGALVSTCDDCGPCGTATVLGPVVLARGSYWVVVDGFSTSSGRYTLTAQGCPGQIVNQGSVGCGINVTGNSATGTHTVGQAAPEHWYQFMAPVDGSYTFNTCGSNYDTWVHIYNRSSSGAVGDRVSTCDDCGPCGVQTVLTTTLSAGLYFVVMDGYGSASGRYNLQIQCPASAFFSGGNLLCDTAVTGNTTGGTSSGGHAAPEHYWNFTSGYAGNYVFDSCGSSFDTFMYVYLANGNALGSLVTSCDDCGPCGLRTVLTARLEQSTAYVVVLDGFSTSNGAYTITARCPISPPASLLNGTINCSAATTGVTTGGPSTVGNAAPDAWYNLSVAITGYYTFDSCGSGFDTWLSVYAQTASGGYGSVVATCDDCGPCGTRTVLSNISLTGPANYWVVVDGFSTSNGAFTLSVTCPVGIPTQGSVACGSNITGDSTTGGTFVTGDPAPEHWYTFTAPTTGLYTFDSCGSQYDTWIHIYTATGPSTYGSQVSSCDDCGPCGRQTVLQVNLPAGNYFVVMDGWSTERGNYTLAITCGGNATVWLPLNCSTPVTGNTTGGVSTIGHDAPEHYFNFTSGLAGRYTFDSCGSGFDTFLYVYQAGVLSGNLGSLVTSCDDCGPCGLRTVLNADLAANTSYVVVVDGFSTSNGVYRMQATCPTTALVAHPADGTIDCSGAVTGTTVGGNVTIASSPERWYTLTINATGRYTFDSCGSGFDTYLNIYRRTTVGTTLGTVVTQCDDCGPCGLRTVLQNVVLAPGDYWVIINGFSTASGTYTLTMSGCGSTNPPTTAPTTPAPTAPPPVNNNTNHNGTGTPVACGQTAFGNSSTGTNQTSTGTGTDDAPEHWWTFTAPVEGYYTFDTCGSGYDTWLHIYGYNTDGSTGALISSCDDCGPCGNRIVLTLGLTPGTYWLVMDGWASSQGTYRMAVTCPANSIIIGDVTCNSLVQNVTSGTISTTGHQAPEHYYRFVAPYPMGTYTFDTCGSAYDTWVHLYQAGQNSTGTSGLLGNLVLSCDDCGPCGTRTVLVATGVVGGNYIVIVDGFSTSSGSYRMTTSCVATTAPPNFELTCTGNNRTVFGDTTGLNSTVGHAAGEQWLTFVAPDRGLYTFDTCGSGYDTYVHIFTRTAGDGQGAQVYSCDDCGPCGLRTVAQVSLSPGNYYVVVDGFSTSSGAWRLTVTCPAQSSAPTTSAPTPQATSMPTTLIPTTRPTTAPTARPTATPTTRPTTPPTANPTSAPPTGTPTPLPGDPTSAPSWPTSAPTNVVTSQPTPSNTQQPVTAMPTRPPTFQPIGFVTNAPVVPVITPAASAGSSSSGPSMLLIVVIIGAAIAIIAVALVLYKKHTNTVVATENARAAFNNPLYAQAVEKPQYAEPAPGDGDGYLDVAGDEDV